MAQAESRRASCREFQTLVRMNRRSVLKAGFGALAGSSFLSQLARRSSAAEHQTIQALKNATPGFGRAKRCIFLFMWGGPSQLDTFDLKPYAPSEIRGPFNPVATKVPGIQLCEHFRHLPGLMDKLAVVRTLTHDDPAHLSSGHATVTGQLAPVLNSDKDPPSAKDSPHVGSLVSKLFPAPPTLPSFVMLPWKAFHPAAPGGEAPGQHGGWLGPTHDPLLVGGDPNVPNWQVPALQLQDGITPEFLADRHALLKNLDSQRAVLDSAAAVDRMTADQAKAASMLSSSEVRKAFDLSEEPAKMRDRYGRNIHGQCVLLARRLVERGVPVVNVNWHNDGQNFWDTHGNNFNRLKNDLIPVADQALAALLTDLSERGMLDDTIVAWVGEFGRRPQISGGSGREHWPYCYSGLLAGGGIAGGAVYGTSDSHAGYPNRDPVSPQDYAATMMQALGVPRDAVLSDAGGRPHQVYGGKPIEALFA
jgi:hypothetical protein